MYCKTIEQRNFSASKIWVEGSEVQIFPTLLLQSNPIWEKIAVQLGNTRLGSGYFDHYQDMRQALKSARANMTLCKYVAGDDNSEYFTELVKLLTSGQKLYKAKRWWSISIVELLFVLQISDESTKGESRP